MKVNRRFIAVPIMLMIAMGMVACSKDPGSGGTSSIKGNVHGLILSSGGSSDPVAEVTTVICAEGAVIDDNDYWLLNSPNGNLYYIWYDNTNWVGGDPSLAGRTGIKVTYDFNQTNVTVANSTVAAIQSVAGNDFSISQNADILTITCTDFGQVADAEDINSPMAIDVQQQGSGGISSGVTGVEGPIADERVYLIYGEEDFYSEDVRTDADGNYQFKGLRKGEYRVYVFSADTTNPNGFLTQVESAVTITKNKQVVDAGQLYMIK